MGQCHEEGPEKQAKGQIRDGPARVALTVPKAAMRGLMAGGGFH